MQRLLIRCLLINLAGGFVSGAILWLYPKGSGFTITTATRTHYIAGGTLPAAVLMCLLNLAIGIYLAWLVVHPR